MEGADLRRWLICGVAAVIAHAGLAAGLTTWRDPVVTDEPAAALVIELAPVVAAPPPKPDAGGAGPEAMETPPTVNVPTDNLDKPEEKTEQKVEAKLERKPEEVAETKPVDESPPLPIVPNAEAVVSLPPPPPVQQVQPQRQEWLPPAVADTAPSVTSEVVAALPTAPVQGTTRQAESKKVQSWKIQVAAVLERNKRYPPDARARREQGVVQVAFSLDAQGRLLASRVQKGAGAVSLDEEAVALLRRAPLPPPPAELGTRVELVVPIRFSLK